MACPMCENEPEPGYIEMPNNGPVVRCPVCEAKEDTEAAQVAMANFDRNGGVTLDELKAEVENG